MPPPPTVALDASLWDEPTTGIALYTRCLAAGLTDAGWRVLRVGARSSGEAPRGAVGRTAYAVGRLPSVLTSLKAPLFHATGNFNLPLTRVPGTRFVLTLHDLIPELFPSSVSWRFRWQFRLWLRRSLTLADRIICVSARTRDDLRARYDVPDEKLVVIHHGVDHVLQTPRPDATGDAFLRTLGLPPAFVLYSGALEGRKNVGLVLEACELLARGGKPATLVLAGQRWFGSAELERKVVALRAKGVDIRPLGYQAAPVFYELMRRAAVLVFPSRYEGFGLPPLEAMRLSVPTIISDAGALPEVCGDGALRVGVDDARGLAAQLARLLEDEAARSALAQRGQRWAERFTWRRAAGQTVEVYRALVEDPACEQDLALQGH